MSTSRRLDNVIVVHPKNGILCSNRKEPTTFLFLLEYNCFTMLCQFLLYSEVNQLYVYLYPLPLGLPSHHPSPPSGPSRSVVTEHRAELPVLYRMFPLAIYFMHDSVYMSILISQFVPPSPSPPVSTCPFSMSTSLFLPCKLVHLYHFSRFHIYALIYDICFSLSDLLHSV